MATRTRLEDVDYYLPLYDEDGDLDHEAYYHRNILAQGRDFGLPGVSDWTAERVMTTFPQVEHFTQATPDVQGALIVLGLAIDSFDPNTPSTTALIDRATTTVHALLTPQEIRSKTMAGETTITAIGNLTSDPELRFTPSGSAVANFTIASTPRTFDRQSNEWKDGETLFLRASIWREAAENVAESLAKGTRVIVSGRLKSRTYDTKEGEKRTVMELEVDEIGPSLRYANAKVNRTQRSSNQGAPAAAAPAAGGQGYQGYQAAGPGIQNGGGNGFAPSSPVTANDPWAIPSEPSNGGWGSGPDQAEPPF